MYLVLLILAAFHAGILQYAKNKLFCNSILSEIFYAQQVIDRVICLLTATASSLAMPVT